MKLHAILGRFGIWGRPLSFETFEDSEAWNFKLVPGTNLKLLAFGDDSPRLLDLGVPEAQYGLTDSTVM